MKVIDRTLDLQCVIAFTETGYTAKLAAEERRFAATGDKILVMGGIPMGKAGSTNFLKIHTIAHKF
ncbi:MAG: pyruvate kinase alpha/beta domain-containing protein [Leptolyngbya sp. BL-A-14]